MAARTTSPLLTWTSFAPALSVVALALTWGRDLGTVAVIIVAVVLAGAVLAAVHHAEVVAHRVGEPFGSLVLAVAVTIIEVALIVTLMASGGKDSASLARDTVFAAVMITCNGIVGLSLFAGAQRYGLISFNAEGTGAALATVTTLAVLTMVVPTFTTSAAGPEFSPGQLAFAAVASLALYAMFVSTQTIRHRDFFLPVSDEGQLLEDDARRPAHRPGDAAQPGPAPAVPGRGRGPGEGRVARDRGGVAAAGFPPSFVGVVIALLVLLPETLAAVRAARRKRIQISLNLALGSAMASIGLTIPAIAIASHLARGPAPARPRPHADGAPGPDRGRQRADRGARDGRRVSRAVCTSCSWRPSSSSPSTPDLAARPPPLRSGAPAYPEPGGGRGRVGRSD